MEVGTTREEEIILRNSGGGELEGQMEVPPPWRILGSKEYRLGRKQESHCANHLCTQRTARSTGKLVFSHDARVASI